jgi:hypothetical protein
MSSVKPIQHAYHIHLAVISTNHLTTTSVTIKIRSKNKLHRQHRYLRQEGQLRIGIAITDSPMQ